MFLRSSTLISLFLVATLCFGCAKYEDAPQAEFANAPSKAEEVDAKPGNSPDGGESQQRMVIRTASITLRSETPQKEVDAVQKLTESLGGFVVSSGTNGGTAVTGASMTLRIPATEFDNAMARLREIAEVEYESMTGQDVTAEFVDLNARLRTQRGLETRFLALLAEAHTVEDTIRVETELARVRTEIERMQGRTQQIENQVKLATINVQINGDGVEDSFGEIGDAFDDAGDIMITVIAGGIRVAAALLPLAIFGAFFLGGLLLIVRRRKKNKDA